jgi:hypothetical protein
MFIFQTTNQKYFQGREAPAPLGLFAFRGARVTAAQTLGARSFYWCSPAPVDANNRANRGEGPRAPESAARNNFRNFLN